MVSSTRLECRFHTNSLGFFREDQMMTVLQFPDPFLFKVAVPVTEFDASLHSLLDSMYETMKANKGMGLAANQVGLSQNMFVMDGEQGRVNLVNPVIIWRSLAHASLREGCLSAPGDFVVVPSRYSTVQVRYQNELGTSKTAVFSGIHSVCCQHEMDHLLGKAFMADKSIPKKIRSPLMKKWRVK